MQEVKRVEPVLTASELIGLKNQMITITLANDFLVKAKEDKKPRKILRGLKTNINKMLTSFYNSVSEMNHDSLEPVDALPVIAKIELFLKNIGRSGEADFNGRFLAIKSEHERSNRKGVRYV